MKILESNPFADLKGGVRGNRSPKPLNMHTKTTTCDSMRPFTMEDRGQSARFPRRLCRNTLRKTGTARISQRSENRSDPAGRPATGKADSRMARSTAVDPRLHPPADRGKSAHRTVIGKGERTSGYTWDHVSGDLATTPQGFARLNYCWRVWSLLDAYLTIMPR